MQIATKLSRNHTIHGETACVVHCSGPIEIDRQASGPRAVSMEDSAAHLHGSRGIVEPTAPTLLSASKIVAELEKATPPPKPKAPWGRWVAD